MNLAQQTTHLNAYVPSQSWSQRQLRLKAMVISANAANDLVLLAILKAQWEALKAELV